MDSEGVLFMYKKQFFCRLQSTPQSGEPFTDPDFPPADRSLYVDPKHPVTRWRVGKWERPMGTRDDFESDGIQWTVARNPRPEDIAQGVLGNCWYDVKLLCIWCHEK